MDWSRVTEQSDIDRAHRIGNKKTDKHGVTRQQMIVKFKSFANEDVQKQEEGKE